MHGIVDEKTDVFSYGVLLLELITGRRPVDSDKQNLVIWVGTIPVSLFYYNSSQTFITCTVQSLSRNDNYGSWKRSFRALLLLALLRKLNFPLLMIGKASSKQRRRRRTRWSTVGWFLRCWPNAAYGIDSSPVCPTVSSMASIHEPGWYQASSQMHQNPCNPEVIIKLSNLSSFWRVLENWWNLGMTGCAIIVGRRSRKEIWAPDQIGFKIPWFCMLWHRVTGRLRLHRRLREWHATASCSCIRVRVRIEQYHSKLLSLQFCTQGQWWKYSHVPLEMHLLKSPSSTTLTKHRRWRPCYVQGPKFSVH